MCTREPLCIPDNMNLVDGVTTRGKEEDELNNAIRTLRKLLAARIGPGEDPHLVPVKRQLKLFHAELEQIGHLIKVARSGGHAIRDANLRTIMECELRALERLNLETKSGRRQLQELSCLSYLAEKKLIGLESSAPNENQYIQRVVDSANKLSQMENRLDIATKQFNLMNGNNRLLQKEIIRLLIERNNFNTVWYRLITHLVRGKLFLLDVLGTANRAFNERSDCMTKLNALKWKANSELDRDTSVMQDLQQMLDQLQKLEEFLRMKGTLRICEAVEIELRKQKEADQIKSNEIDKLNCLIDGIREYCQNKSLVMIVEYFHDVEVRNMAIFRLICFVYSDYKDWQLKIGPMQKEINNQCIINSSVRTKEMTQLQKLIEKRDEYHQSGIDLQSENTKVELALMKTIRGTEELARLAKINLEPLIVLLGSGRTIHKYNIMLYYLQIQRAVMNNLLLFKHHKSMAKIVKKPDKKGIVKKEPLPTPDELVQTIIEEKLRPNNISKLVTYQPCAYCVEEYIMNQVRDEQWEVFTDEAAKNVLQSDEPNTPFGIFTITDPSKRHPVAGFTMA